MIVDARKMEILALAGSVEFGPIAAGFNNGCVARRSGGSILKPFLYALAFEQGLYPSFVIADTMQPFKTPQGEYLPYNADRRDYGPVTIRNALGNSLNVSAVKMLNIVGIKDFFHLLVELELLDSFSGAADFFGLGLAIGNPEIRMVDLVRAYGVLVNEGRLRSLSFLANDKIVEKQAISPGSAYLIFDILSDPAARLLTFGTPAFFKFSSRWALKTGTSTNYRDSWLVACNRSFIIALWVGNFDGTPTRSLSGASACGPVVKNIVSALEASGNIEPVPVPAEISRVKVCSISGQKPGSFCKLTGFDLVDGDADSLPECQFHRSEKLGHELPADYARWIQHRARVNDADPFQLLGNLRSPDAWRIFGLPSESEPVALASGPIVLQGEPENAGWNNIKIVAPHDGDRFILAAYDNFLHLRAIPEQPVEEIIWLVNGSEFIRTPPPYEAYWPMREGKIRITALSSGEAAAEVEILIER
jgi:penicillin-binding protein 1C